MRFLLDTQIMLWIVADSPRLTDRARDLLLGPEKETFFSVASLWEIGIKFGLGRLDFSPLLISEAMLESGYKRLPIADQHLATLVGLPLHHRDPFDRMLVAQAISEPLTLVTADRRLEAYKTNIEMV